MSTQTRQKKYIELKTEKSFGDMIGMPFTFFFQEFKGLMLAILKYAGPVFAFAILIAVLMLKDNFSSLPFQGTAFPENKLIFSFFFVWFFFMLGFQLIIATAFHYLSVYEEKGKGNFTIKDVGIGLFMTVLKIIGASLLIGLLSVIVMFVVSLIPVVGPIILLFGMIYVSVNLSLFPFIIAYEKVGIGTALTRSFELIKGKWWFSFGLYLVFFIIIYISMYTAMIPMIVVGFVTPFIGTVSKIGMIIMITLFIIIIFFIYIMLITLMNVLFGFQYFNLRVRKEGINLTDRISAINENTKEEGDVFEVKEVTEESEEDEKEKTNELSVTENEDELKQEDEWRKLLDENQRKNRFEGDDKENDSLKPKL